MLTISLIFLFLAAINIPFGVVRSSSPRFSRKWGRCIYIPILLSIAVRRVSLVSYKFMPFFLFATLAGQIVGGKIKKMMAGSVEDHTHQV